MQNKLPPILIAVGVFSLCWWAVQGQQRLDGRAPLTLEVDELSQAVLQVNGHFELRWKRQDLIPAQAADELQVLRRLTLCLMGTVPSLEEIRQFEADEQPDRLERWTLEYLDDPRFADYFAERLARCFVGTENGAFLIFRRDRFVSWLSTNLRNNKPYDEIVRDLIASDGLWTGEPESNFITAALANDDLDENKLATRSARAFLGQSIDCAQCHDHEFAEWKQTQFEGIAAQFGEVNIGRFGVNDNVGNKYKIQDRKTLIEREIEPAVPFNPEWLPDHGNAREKFAAWMTHKDNRYFERAIVNRVWGLMFGAPYIAPVDDMGDLTEPDERDVLDILGDDFEKHGYDLRRLIQVIAASKPFRLDSFHYQASDADAVDTLEYEWAMFPLTRLRPEQIIGAMLQTSYVQTIDQNSHLFVRGRKFFGEREFVESYGDLGDNELEERSGTIPQALLRMNSNMTRGAISTDGFSTANRISAMCETNEDVIEVCFLVCASRRPTQAEKEHFLAELTSDEGKRSRDPIVEDLLWVLINSPEFSWNH
jgi:hypothetical protein